ncbi:hypothetical protein CB0940_02595 [Cercospora beticola]|uniref:Nuclear GTPase SLIP-GC n=1 Tax=Cercospora beticola TaxID=122368 RepID=A0A2G5I5S2_CERBT|nr:hypothetical protein CB0940_02595 [Cercospora beticola]PIB00158.1 hypothetical protein CB0940_02595 [Cercospora beticola]WPA99739.1 hypothetical protein RHO25_004358 [Cercospora beticola]
MASVAASPSPYDALGKRKRSQSVESCGTDDDKSGSPLPEGANKHDSNSDTDSEQEASEGDNADDENLFVDDNEHFDENDMSLEDELDPDAIYCEAKEAYPKLPAYDPVFSEIENGLTGIVEHIIDLVGRFPCKSTYVKNFRAKAEELRAVPRPQPMRIALLGDTGAGKSSLLNSIVDVPNIAKAISSGESCTATAMEYCSSIDGQREDFAAEITYYDEETAKALLREHLAHYRHNAEVQADWDDDTRQLYKRRADTAVKTLHALFCDKEEMSSLQSAEEMLGQSIADSGKVARKLQKWCKELFVQMDLNTMRTVRRETSSARAFREAVDPLLQATSCPTQPNLWPLVMFVRVGIRRSRVLKYASIADLPGISDTNAVKVNAANAYIRQCDGLWIVAPIGRAVNSTTVDSLYAKYGERFQDNIAIICTRAEDEINSNLAEHFENEKRTTAAYDKSAQKCRDLQSQLSKAKRGLQGRERGAPTKERKQKIRAVQKAIKNIEKQKDKADQDRLCNLVEVRNRFVSSGLERELKGHLPQGKKPTIFCVSNAHYSSFKGVAETATKFQLSAKQTGIPALRKHVLALAAPALLTALEDYVQHHFLVFLKGVQLWVIRKNVQGAEALLDLVRQPQKSLPTRFNVYRKECHDLVAGKLLTQSTDKIEGFVSEAGTKWTEKIHRFHWSTLRAFIRNSGSHSTSTCPRTSWNMEFWGKAPFSLITGWNNIKKLQSKAITKQVDSIVEELSSMEPALRSQPAVTNLEMDSFYELLKGHIAGVKNARRDHQAVFGKELENIRMDASGSESPTHHFVIAMQPVYTQLKADKGNGYVKRQEKVMYDYLTQKGEACPFDVAFEAIASAIESQMEQLSEQLEKQISTILEEIWAHFDGMIDPDEQDPGEQPLRDELRGFLEQAVPAFEAFREGLSRINQKKKTSVKTEEVDEE